MPFFFTAKGHLNNTYLNRSVKYNRNQFNISYK